MCEVCKVCNYVSTAVGGSTANYVLRGNRKCTDRDRSVVRTDCYGHKIIGLM